MAFLVHRPHDCSIPYKKFQELEDNDIIYFIDFKSLKLEKYQVIEVKTKEVPEWDDRKNCIEVEFKIEGFDRDSIQKVYDGNNYIWTFYWNGEGRFFTTDKRIGQSILEILRHRNSYQWSALTGLFGNPLSQYAHKDIKLA